MLRLLPTMADDGWDDREWERWVEEQREIEELPPAGWWEWWVAATGNGEADLAFKRLVELGCKPGELLEALRELHRRSQLARFSLPELRDHAARLSELATFLERLRSTELVYYERLADSAARLMEPVEQHRKAVEAAAESLKREPEGVTKPLIAEVERIVQRDTGHPHDNHVAVLLTAVAVPLRSPEALRVARGRRKRRSLGAHAAPTKARR